MSSKKKEPEIATPDDKAIELVENPSTEVAEGEVKKPMTTEERFARNEEMMLDMFNLIKKMNNNLTEGYATTVKTLEANLKPVGTVLQAMLTNQQQQAAQGQVAGAPLNPAGTIQGSQGQYFSPNGQAGQAGQMNPQMEMFMMVMKMLGGDGGQNAVFTQMGQRMFIEQTLGQIMERRSMYRTLMKKGLLEEAEVHQFEMIQDKLYGNMLGMGMGLPNGQATDKSA